MLLASARLLPGFFVAAAMVMGDGQSCVDLLLLLPLLCCLLHLCLVPGGGFVSEAQLGLFSFGRGCWASCLLLQLRFVCSFMDVAVVSSCCLQLLWAAVCFDASCLAGGWLVAVLLGGLVLRLLLCVADVVAVSPCLC